MTAGVPVLQMDPTDAKVLYLGLSVLTLFALETGHLPFGRSDAEEQEIRERLPILKERLRGVVGDARSLEALERNGGAH